jgi:hypothetical protein
VGSASFDRRGVQRSRELGEAFRCLARNHGVLCADAAQAARAGGDGVHLALDSHASLAELIGQEVRRALLR